MVKKKEKQRTSIYYFLKKNTQFFGFSSFPWFFLLEGQKKGLGVHGVGIQKETHSQGMMILAYPDESGLLSSVNFTPQRSCEVKGRVLGHFFGPYKKYRPLDGLWGIFYFISF